jgi:hypothetical protein
MLTLEITTDDNYLKLIKFDKFTQDISKRGTNLQTSKIESIGLFTVAKHPFIIPINYLDKPWVALHSSA